MRNILFRGKRVDNGEWVYGSYYKHIARQICPIGDKLEECDIIHLMIQSGFADWNMSRPLQATEVIPKTVGQYTGREDKNGMSMFEGDIFENEDGIGFIRWSSDMYAFVIEYFGYPDDIMLLEELLENTKVIGNIHEKGK